MSYVKIVILISSADYWIRQYFIEIQIIYFRGLKIIKKIKANKLILKIKIRPFEYSDKDDSFKFNKNSLIC